MGRLIDRADEGAEPLASMVDRLTAQGYREDLAADDNGALVAGDGRVYDVDEVVVDQAVRFEGSTDPDDQAIVFVLRAPRDGMRGTYVVPFGPSIDQRDAAVASRLRPRG